MYAVAEVGVDRPTRLWISCERRRTIQQTAYSGQIVDRRPDTAPHRKQVATDAIQYGGYRAGGTAGRENGELQKNQSALVHRTALRSRRSRNETQRFQLRSLSFYAYPTRIAADDVTN